MTDHPRQAPWRCAGGPILNGGECGTSGQTRPAGGKEEGDGGMRIRYENTMEDLVAFNRYHHSATVRQARLGCLSLTAGVVLVVTAANSRTFVINELAVLLGGAIGVL